jgi:hypothetical protein
MSTYTYEVVLRVEVTEDNPDMPSTNIWTYGTAIAEQAKVLWPSDDCVVTLSNATIVGVK